MKILALLLAITGAAVWILVLAGLAASACSTAKWLWRRRARRRHTAGLSFAEELDVLTTIRNEDRETR